MYAIAEKYRSEPEVEPRISRLTYELELYQLSYPCVYNSVSRFISGFISSYPSVVSCVCALLTEGGGGTYTLYI